jgi:hypothetical protein
VVVSSIGLQVQLEALPTAFFGIEQDVGIGRAADGGELQVLDACSGRRRSSGARAVEQVGLHAGFDRGVVLGPATDLALKAPALCTLLPRKPVAARAYRLTSLFSA